VVTGAGDEAAEEDPLEPLEPDPLVPDPLEVDPLVDDACRFADAVALAVPCDSELDAVVVTDWVVASAGSLPDATRM
jgi:hypothetical protein